MQLKTIKTAPHPSPLPVRRGEGGATRRAVGLPARYVWLAGPDSFPLPIGWGEGQGEGFVLLHGSGLERFYSPPDKGLEEKPKDSSRREAGETDFAQRKAADQDCGSSRSQFVGKGAEGYAKA